MIAIGIIIFNGIQSLDVTGPMDVFSEANRFLLPDNRYRLTTIGIEGREVRCSNGLKMLADVHWSEATGNFDLLLVSGGDGLMDRHFDPGFYDWLRASAAASRRIGSICNGALILGRAGLLADRMVTTHWDSAQTLAALYPDVRVAEDKIYIQDGNLYTSAGVTAGIDMALFILRQEMGAEIALNVAKRLVVVMQRAGGQSQFSPYISTYADISSPLATAQRHVLSNLQDRLSLEELAKASQMSVRNFSRLFHKELGVTPSEFVERARVDAARSMLESGRTPLKTIAHACGFRTPGRMRNAFIRCLGVTPQHYRLSFNA